VFTGSHQTLLHHWFDDIALSSIAREYKKLGTLKGVSTLDEITVTVKGSMYDDVN
jgi:FMN-dependent NADH-azoreductase